ncbi:extracellular calcium-sensing receptor-like [Bombina bombina]|uniref:extracellular calcium-sensing receptor-like n=1 Tax=Bombina bombina TaxID=8345 RepID=UPI00235B2254|nr:extracellular calcium-sensing receptor-like [Bombina bombina]
MLRGYPQIEKLTLLFTMRVSLQIILVTVSLSCVEGVRRECLLSSSSLTGYSEDGRITLGMVGPINTQTSKKISRFTSQPAPQQCNLFRRDQYKSILAILFATEEVNRNPNLLPNITLGFQMFDSCFSEASALQATVQAISGNSNIVPNYECQSRVPAVIGDPLSASSVAMARVLGLWKVPQVSYAASLPNLSNKLEFPSFLRTIVSVDAQPYALIELCKAFGWNWIGVLITSTDYGTVGGLTLKTEATRNGICFAFFETIRLDSIDNQMAKMIEIVRMSTASVVILFASPPEVNAVFVEVLQQNVTGKLWVGIEAWFTSPVFYQKEYWTLLNGTIGIARSKKILPHFANFLQNIYPSKYSRMLSIRQFWERYFNCNWVDWIGNSSSSAISSTSRTCTGLEKLVTNDVTESNDPTSQSVYMAHNALYAVAHALHNLLTCRTGEGPFTGGSCANKYDFQPWQVLHYLKRVQFENTAGEQINFNANGDILGHFDILNWQLAGIDTSTHVRVGIFNNYITNLQKLVMNESLIQWPKGYFKVPHSICSESCSPGYRKAPQRGQPVCCFDCVLCPDGMISSQTDAIDCAYCPEDQWPNSKQDKCIPKVIEFLSYDEPLGMVLASFSIIFSVITVMVLCVYLKFQDTTVVKANNRNLSYLLLLSLTFCFLCSLIFIGRPTNMACTIRRTLFSVTFALCISCVLAKTIIVVIAFKATKPGSSMRQWLGTKTTILVVFTSTCIQVVIIMFWLVIAPPFLERNAHMVAGVILLICNEGSITMYYCSLGYLGVLSLLSFVVAFLARNLPDSFNEAKHITFSMLTFLSVWLSFIPAYLSTKGKYITGVEIFAILLSSTGLFACIFCPKCYIIIFRPSMNTKEYLMSSKTKS